MTAYSFVFITKFLLARILLRIKKRAPLGFANLKGNRMDTDNRLFSDTAERLPALLLAVAATFFIFAAINAGFTPDAMERARQVQAAQPGLGL